MSKAGVMIFLPGDSEFGEIATARHLEEMDAVHQCTTAITYFNHSPTFKKIAIQARASPKRSRRNQKA